MNAPDRNLHDAADGELRAQAIENISERIKSGKSRMGIRDLIDCEMTSRPEFLLTELEQVLLAEHGEHGALADKLVEGLIERYIGAHADLVEEEASTIEHYEQEEA